MTAFYNTSQKCLNLTLSSIASGNLKIFNDLSVVFFRYAKLSSEPLPGFLVVASSLSAINAYTGIVETSLAYEKFYKNKQFLYLGGMIDEILKGSVGLSDFVAGGTGVLLSLDQLSKLLVGSFITHQKAMMALEFINLEFNLIGNLINVAHHVRGVLLTTKRLKNINNAPNTEPLNKTTNTLDFSKSSYFHVQQMVSCCLSISLIILGRIISQEKKEEEAFLVLAFLKISLDLFKNCLSFEENSFFSVGFHFFFLIMSLALSIFSIRLSAYSSSELLPVISISMMMTSSLCIGLYQHSSQHQKKHIHLPHELI